MRREAKNTSRYLLGTLCAAGALNAVGGAIYGFAGAKGIPLDWLTGSRFHDYSIPSLILLVAVGGSLALSAIMVLSRRRHARPLAVAAAAIVVGWAVAQVWIIGYRSWLQPAVAVFGLVIFGLALLLRRPEVAGTVTLEEAATRFLRQKRIAVTGVSRHPETHGGNVVYRRLRQRGYQVFAINPNTSRVEGDPSYPDLASIPGGVDAVVIATQPQRADATLRECAGLGIKYAWMHRAFGAGSVSGTAAAFGRAHGIEVIEGGCPCMFAPASDPGHVAMRFCLTLTGTVPRHVCRASAAAV